MHVSVWKIGIILLISILVSICIYDYFFTYVNPTGKNVIYAEKKDAIKIKDTIRPDLGAKHLEIDKVLSKSKDIKCKTNKNWTYTSKGRLYITDEATRKYGPIKCSITNLQRLDDFSSTLSQTINNVKSGYILPFSLFTISCAGSSGTYRNIHYAILPVKKHKGYYRSLMYMDYKLPSVLVIGFDSVSQSSWFNNMPKTREFFIKHLNGVELKGYNVVGEETSSAFLPLLTGLSESEAKQRFKNARTVDEYPWIWKDYKIFRYVTHLTKDSPGLSTFSDKTAGFKNIPTNFYTRPFYIEAIKRNFESNFCHGSIRAISTALDWTEELFEMFPKDSILSFTFLSSYSHSMSKLDEVDEELHIRLNKLHSKGHLRNAVVVLMSDYSPRIDAQQQINRRFPYFAFRVPPYFHLKYPEAMENLQRNTEKVVTAFDIHATLKTLLSPNKLHKPIIGNNKNRSISLFDKIPIGRM